MTRIILVVVFCLSLNCHMIEDIGYYKAAYEYIINLPEIKEEGEILVADTLIYLEQSNFWEELSGDQKDKTVLFKLDSLDRIRSFDNTYSPILDKTFKTSEIKKHTLFFSKVYGDILLAEVIDNKGLGNESYERITAFNKSKVFLFKFNEDKKIERVFHKEMQYD